MKKIISLMLFVSIVSYSLGQTLPGVPDNWLQEHSRFDFNFGSGNKLTVFTLSTSDLKKHQNIDSVLALFWKNYQQIKPTLEETTNSRTATYQPAYDGGFRVILTEHPSTNQRFHFRAYQDEPLLLKTTQDTLLIVLNNSKENPISVHLSNAISKNPKQNTVTKFVNPQTYFCFIVNQLDDIEKLIAQGTANTHIQQLLEKIAAHKKHDLNNPRFKIRYFSHDELKVSNLRVVRKNRGFGVFHQTFGVGVFRNQLVPNAQTEFSFLPNKYNNIGYTLGWRSMFWTSHDEQTNRWRTQSNGVLQVGFTIYGFENTKLPRSNTNEVYYGLYLGRVMTRNGDIFEPNTWNLSMTVAAHGIVKIQPEVYFNGFFSRNVMPCLRVQVGF
ncbi:MAG: hypothetical protein ACK4GN_12600 [Runella sp.]